jgi:hypothetical protein
MPATAEPRRKSVEGSGTGLGEEVLFVLSFVICTGFVSDMSVRVRSKVSSDSKMSQ